MRIFMIAFLFMAAVVVEAQIKGKKTTVSFDDQLIHGTRSNPETLMSCGKSGLNLKKLVRVRENFLPELRQSASVHKTEKITKP